MKNIKFAIPIYTDMQTIFDIATSNDKEKLDVVGHVIDEIKQGDPVWDDIVEQLTDIFGEGIEEYLDMANLEEFIEWDGTFDVKYDEMPTTEPDILVYIVDCTLNVNNFAERMHAV